MKDRLQQIRKHLLKNNIQAFFIHTADPYQNEYQAECYRRLQWISNFTGSYGFLIITQTEASLFVDGRYTLQATQEVDSTLFTVHPIFEKDSWILNHLPSGSNIGYDPWLIPYSHLSDWQKKYKSLCFTFMPLIPNPVDIYWTNRPSFPHKEAFSHSIDYTGADFFEKRELVLDILNNLNLDAFFLSQSESVNWLLNLRGYDLSYTPLFNSYACIHVNGYIDVFCDVNRLPQGEFKDSFQNFVHWHPLDKIPSILTQIHNKRIGFDPNQTPVALASLFHQPTNIVKPHQDPCLLLKSVKNSIELKGAHACHKRDGIAMAHFLAWFYNEAPLGKITEIDASNYLEECRKAQNLFHSLSFPTISAFGKNGAVIHYHPTASSNTKITPGNLYLIDSGGQYLDGTTDVTRTVAVGMPTLEQCDRYTRVLKGHIALAQAVFPHGTTGGQLDILARQFLWQAGLDYAHGTGHGVGSFLNVHEGPQRIGKQGSHIALKPGMILSNEPGYYKENHYGIRLESLITIVKAPDFGYEPMLTFETLTLVPFDKSLMRQELLTSDEILWIDDYHQYIYKQLSPHLEGETLKWLLSATKPLNF